MGVEGVLSASTENGIVSAESICDRVHIVHADASIHLLPLRREKTIGPILYCNTESTVHTFYANGFYGNEDSICIFDEIEEDGQETEWNINSNTNKCILIVRNTIQFVRRKDSRLLQQS